MSDTCVVGTESSRRHRAECVAKGIEPAQPHQFENHAEDQIQNTVHASKEPGSVLHPSLRSILTGPRHFRAHHRLAGGTLSQDDDKQNDDAKAAEKVGAASPEKHAMCDQVRIFQVGNDRRSRCAKPRLGFKHRVCNRHWYPTETIVLASIGRTDFSGEQNDVVPQRLVTQPRQDGFCVWTNCRELRR